MASNCGGLRRAGEQRNTPAPERINNGLELFAPFGQPEERCRNRRRRVLSLYDAGLFQVAKAIRKQIRGDSRESILQVGIAGASARQQLANDEQSPAIADDLERFRQSAVLLV